MESEESKSNFFKNYDICGNIFVRISSKSNLKIMPNEETQSLNNCKLMTLHQLSFFNKRYVDCYYFKEYDPLTITKTKSKTTVNRRTTCLNPFSKVFTQPQKHSSILITYSSSILLLLISFILLMLLLHTTITTSATTTPMSKATITPNNKHLNIYLIYNDINTGMNQIQSNIFLNRTSNNSTVQSNNIEVIKNSVHDTNATFTEDKHFYHNLYMYYNITRSINSNSSKGNNNNIKQWESNQTTLDINNIYKKIINKENNIDNIFNFRLLGKHESVVKEYKKENNNINKDFKIFALADVSKRILKKQLLLQEQQSNYTKNDLDKIKNYGSLESGAVAHASDDIYLKRSRFEDANDNEKLMKLVMEGLGMQKLPDMSKVNISQLEYTSKYMEYLRRIHKRKRREASSEAPLHIISIVTNTSENYASFLKEHYRRTKRDLTLFDVMEEKNINHNVRYARHTQYEKTNILLHFSLNSNLTKLSPENIEEANVRLMLVHSPALATKYASSNHSNVKRKCGTASKPVQQRTMQKNVINLKIYQLLRQGKRKWLDGRKIDIEMDYKNLDDTHSQWLQFDVTKAVIAWVSQRESSAPLGLEVQCDNCRRIGARILNDISVQTLKSNFTEYDFDSKKKDFDPENGIESLMPVLNIIGYLSGMAQKHETRKQQYNLHHSRHTIEATNKGNCFKKNQRCCRHTMEVIFKEIKGFEFIIQPKVFDAGYCHGRCPPRYNPAHHHAVLQSLIWKQNRTHAPHPCCAPSKLVELEVLHVDEKDSEKLKISTWTDMRVIECACS